MPGLSECVWRTLHTANMVFHLCASVNPSSRPLVLWSKYDTSSFATLCWTHTHTGIYIFILNILYLFQMSVPELSAGCLHVYLCSDLSKHKIAVWAQKVTRCKRKGLASQTVQCACSFLCGPALITCMLSTSVHFIIKNRNSLIRVEIRRLCDH